VLNSVNNRACESYHVMPPSQGGVPIRALDVSELNGIETACALTGLKRSS